MGVVAALTIPNLAHRIQNKILETQFKHSVAVINKAIKLAKLELDVDTFSLYCTYYTNDYTNFDSCLKAVFNNITIKNKKNVYWGRAEINRNLADFKTYSGKSVHDVPNHLLQFAYTLPDGSYLMMNPSGYMWNITLDVNGPKGPNRLGYDVFLMNLSKSTDALIGRKPSGKVYTDEELEEMAKNKQGWYVASTGAPCNEQSSQGANGIGCAWYALQNICPQTGKPGYFECLPK